MDKRRLRAAKSKKTKKWWVVGVVRAAQCVGARERERKRWAEGGVEVFSRVRTFDFVGVLPAEEQKGARKEERGKVSTRRKKMESWRCARARTR